MGKQATTEGRGRGFLRSEHGNVAMLFALACLVIFPLVGFAIDFSRVIVEKHKLQQATDAAALAAAHDAFMSEEDRRKVIDAHLDHLQDVLGRDVSYDFSQDAEGRISLVTRISVNTTLAKIMGKDEVNVTVRSDAVEGGADIEVAMILDITGSMAGSRITALRTAATDLVNIVVKDDQTPYYSKAAMVPYAVAVNPGTYADAVRGAVKSGASITAAVWQDGTTKNITGATKANPVVITSNGHGFSNGDKVYIQSVKGMTQLNNTIYTVAGANANTFQLKNVNGSSYSNYTNSGTIKKCINTDCEVKVTVTGHGFSTGDQIVIKSAKGMTQINSGTNATWTLTKIDNNNFYLDGSNGTTYGAYTNSGVAYCTTFGCEYFRFSNANNGAQRVYRTTPCATERTGAQAFTDVTPTGNPVGFHYAKDADECPPNVVIPLTADKNLLIDAVEDLMPTSSTAGHMGAAWGLYTLSPTFGAIFPSDSVPAAFGRPKLYKFAVFMTDGEFNSSFCKSVLAKGTYGSASDQINCTSENGDSFAQAQQYCTAMKTAGIKVYTVGLEVSNNTLKTALTNCATSSQFAYFPAKAEDLITVFQQIGRDINEVRLVH